MQHSIIIIFSKILTFILKLTGKGSGTALPGLIIEKYFPNLFDYLVKQIPNIIVITGTNGKTSTQTILKSILKKAGFKVMRNHAGANLKRGIISELIKRTNIIGIINYKYAIFEVEEATLPKIAKILNPKFIVVTNLFRDQLDAYGEIDTTREYIKKSIKQCPNAKIILNFDDPHVKSLGENVSNELTFVSLPKDFKDKLPYEGEQDNSSDLRKSNYITANNLTIDSDLNTHFKIEGSISSQNFSIDELVLHVPGFYHTYNALNAIAVAKFLGIDNTNIQNGVNSFYAAFGRGESIKYKVNNKEIDCKLFLIKNPAGFSLNLDLLAKSSKTINLMILINDNTADGKDISWIWDSKVEILNVLKINKMYIGGKRANDMSVRVKYALRNNKEFVVDEDIESLINSVVDDLDDTDSVYVLPTYTAMLNLRKILGKKLEE